MSHTVALTNILLHHHEHGQCSLPHTHHPLLKILANSPNLKKVPNKCTIFSFFSYV